MCRAVARWSFCCEAEERPVAVAGQILDGREEAHSQPFLQAGPPEHRFDALASWAGKNIFLRHFEEKTRLLGIDPRALVRPSAMEARVLLSLNFENYYD